MRVKKMMAGKLSCHHQPSPESLKFLIMFGLARLISRSSTCSDNHKEKGKVLERHKAAGTALQP